MAAEFIKKFADKNETKRALKYLEKLIKEKEAIEEYEVGEVLGVINSVNRNFLARTDLQWILKESDETSLLHIWNYLLKNVNQMAIKEINVMIESMNYLNTSMNTCCYF